MQHKYQNWNSVLTVRTEAGTAKTVRGMYATALQIYKDGKLNRNSKGQMIKQFVMSAKRPNV